MVNLLKKQKNIEYKPDEAGDLSMGQNQEEFKKQKKNININSYHDPAGLTIGKMNFGFWFISKVPVFKKIIYIILGVIGAVTWSVFFFTFGKYYIFDIRSDRTMFSNLMQAAPVSHEMILERMPKKLIMGDVLVITADQEKYSYSVEATNPNATHWLTVEYYFYSDAGKTDSVKSFILPGQTKNFVSLANEYDRKPADAVIVFSQEDWRRIDSKKIPDYPAFFNDRINFDYKDMKFTPANSSSLSEKIPLNSFDFSMQNNSVFNYWDVPLNIFFYGNNSLQGISQITIEKIRSGDMKRVSLTIPGRIGAVRDITIQPEINIFDKSVYMEFEDKGAALNYE
jgi:hypothetical protein